MTKIIDALDWFCGAGGTSTGVLATGRFKVIVAANHWSRAVETHADNHPQIDHWLADLQEIDPADMPAARVLFSTPECFVAGTLVFTASGWRPIEAVNIGTLVLTHLGRWRPVVRVQHSKAQNVVTVSGQGHTPGLTATPNHRFLARPSSRAEHQLRKLDEAKWLATTDLIDKEANWATPVTVDPLPSEGARSLDGWWVIGRWLGDGSAERGGISICSGNHEADELEKRLAGDDYGPWRRRQLRTATLFTLWNAELARWFEAQFGRGAAGKTIPAWVFGLPADERQALLDGYVSADGSEGSRRVQTDTVSKTLALSIRLLAEGLGHRCGLYRYEQRSNVIEGRHVNVRPVWKVTWEQWATEREARVVGQHAWSRVRKVSAGGEPATVYNLEVADDHSYVVEGIVVKNCTNHSGSNALRIYQQGPSLFESGDWDGDPTYLAQERSRATMSCSLRYAEKHKPEFVVHENVVEVAWWGIQIPGKKRGDGQTYQWWRREWDKLGYEVHELFLNSAVFGAAQLRDRFIIVCRRKDVPKPDFDFTPACWCPQCERVVEGHQKFRKRTAAWPLQAWGRLGRQYDYVCGHCRARAQLIAPGAYTIIDWSDLGKTIGERADAGQALTATTLERVRRGFTKWSDEAWVMPCRTKAYGSEAPVGRPLHTLTARQDKALVVPPFFQKNLAPVTDEAMIVELRGGGSKVSGQRSVRAPLGTVTAGGFHHALAVPPAMFAKNNGKADDTVYHPTSDPLGTVTCGDTTSLVSLPPNAFLAPYYNTGVASHVSDPTPTVTTHDRFALASMAGSVDLDDVHFRMLSPAELQAAQTFPGTYRIAGNKREQTRQIGDAVPCVLAEAVANRIADALEGVA